MSGQDAPDRCDAPGCRRRATRLVQFKNPTADLMERDRWLCEVCSDMAWVGSKFTIVAPDGLEGLEEQG